jgi:hypothetical protein
MHKIKRKINLSPRNPFPQAERKKILPLPVNGEGVGGGVLLQPTYLIARAYAGKRARAKFQ